MRVVSEIPSASEESLSPRGRRHRQDRGDRDPSLRSGFQKKRLPGGVVRALGMVAALAVVWIIFTALTGGIFLEPRNFSNLMRQAAVTGILSVGMVMVIIAGQIDLSVGSLVGLTGMAAVLGQTYLHWGLVPSLLASVVVGVVIGALQGSLTAYARIPAFIVTLGGLLAWRGLAKGISGGSTYPVEVPSFKAFGQAYLDTTAGIVMMIAAIGATVLVVLRGNAARKRHGLPPWSPLALVLRIAFPSALIAGFVLALNAYAGVPVPVLLFVTIALAGVVVTQHTRFGRYLYAIGGNPEAARFSGINLPRHVLLTFVILGALTGIAGIIYTARVGSAAPDAGTLLELDAIAACVIGGASLMGGRGTVLGACLGALLMASLDNGMSLKNVPDFIQDIIKGGILVTAVGLDVLGRRRD
jgi:D-xylose transport system permease protein